MGTRLTASGSPQLARSWGFPASSGGKGTVVPGQSAALELRGRRGRRSCLPRWSFPERCGFFGGPPFSRRGRSITFIFITDALFYYYHFLKFYPLSPLESPWTSFLFPGTGFTSGRDTVEHKAEPEKSTPQCSRVLSENGIRSRDVSGPGPETMGNRGK